MKKITIILDEKAAKELTLELGLVQDAAKDFHVQRIDDPSAVSSSKVKPHTKTHIPGTTAPQEIMKRFYKRGRLFETNELRDWLESIGYQRTTSGSTTQKLKQLGCIECVNYGYYKFSNPWPGSDGESESQIKLVK